MLELAPDLLPLLRAGEPVAVVTVARVARSAPRGAGAAMAVTRDGRVLGSISGGCVEGDAVLLANEVLVTGRTRRATLGFSDEAAHAAGLACGGSVEVVVHRVSADDAAALASLARVEADLPARVGVVLDGPARGNLVAHDDLPPTAETDVLPLGDHPVLVVVHQPRRRLVVVGAGEHAMALARVGHAAGFAVVVCDVWERLVTAERFPSAALHVGDATAVMAELVGESPERAAVCVLTHDERVDVPAIAAALREGAGFVGAMGARSTVAHRRSLLQAAGVPESLIRRLHSPLGLDLGGISPDETALSVLAQIVAAHRGGTASPLDRLDGPLHRRQPASACAIKPQGALS